MKMNGETVARHASHFSRFSPLEITPEGAMQDGKLPAGNRKPFVNNATIYRDLLES
jgi:hypothetical protein